MAPTPPSKVSIDDVFRLAMYGLTVIAGILTGVSLHPPQNITPCFFAFGLMLFTQWGVSKSGRAAQFLLIVLFILAAAATAGILSLF